MPQTDTTITLDAGRYRLREALAGSSYGLVWRASSEDAGPDVALKLINRAQMARAEAPQRRHWIDSAHNEIAFLRTLAPWDERHIVRLLDSGVHAGLPVLALELMDGDLGRHLALARQTARPPAIAQVLGWIDQLNQALAKVHQYGWRYLDLKPANVLRHGGDGGVRLADFGTSRPLDERQPHAYTGSAGWQAPEQFFPRQDGFDTDARSDYFALGALFYYLVTGGVALRYCVDCGAAYRSHQTGGAARILERHAGRIPPTLYEDEAALFARRFDGVQPPGAAPDATWCPAATPAAPPAAPPAAAPAASLATPPANDAGAAALALLRSLLAAERAERPQHALQISRALSAIRAALFPAPDHTPAGQA